MCKILKNGQKTGKNGQKCPKLNFFENKLKFGSKNLTQNSSNSAKNSFFWFRVHFYQFPEFPRIKRFSKFYRCFLQIQILKENYKIKVTQNCILKEYQMKRKHSSRDISAPLPDFSAFHTESSCL